MLKFRNVTPSLKEGGCECARARAKTLVDRWAECETAISSNFLFFLFDKLSTQPREKAPLTTVSRVFGYNNRVSLILFLLLALFLVLSSRCADITFFMVYHKLVTTRL